jgi:hypothetical protein
MDAGGRATQEAKAEFIEINEHFEKNLTPSEQAS